MRGFALSAFLFCACPFYAASIPTLPSPDLTIVVDFQRPTSRASAAAMKQELQGILSPSGVTLKIRSKEELIGRSEEGELVYFAMKGSCTMDPSPNDFADSGRKKALALTYGTDGDLLAMGEVECDRIRTSLEHVLGAGNPAEHEHQFGTALARVMAHEMYHMLLNAHSHGSETLTKESLSPRDLLGGRVAFSQATATQLRDRLLHHDVPGSGAGM